MSNIVVDSLDNLPWTDIAPTFVKLPYQAYKNRQLIHNLWKRLLVASGNGKTDIIITGRSAVGKTVLSNRWWGMTEDLAYDLPELSRDVETAAIGLTDWTKIVRVIPGQTGRQRDLALHEAFNAHTSLQGVIHVVDWGYTPERDSIVRQEWIEKEGVDTLEKWREHNLQAELAEFEKVCEQIRMSYSRCKRPKWLVIAVTKCDLFMDRLPDAQNYYHPDTISPFTAILSNLHTQIGKDNLPCVAVPVSSWDKDFEWNGEIVKSNSGGTSESRALFRHFIHTVSTITETADNKK